MDRLTNRHFLLYSCFWNWKTTKKTRMWFLSSTYSTQFISGFFKNLIKWRESLLVSEETEMNEGHFSAPTGSHFLVYVYFLISMTWLRLVRWSRAQCLQSSNKMPIWEKGEMGNKVTHIKLQIQTFAAWYSQVKCEINWEAQILPRIVIFLYFFYLPIRNQILENTKLKL